MPGSVARTRRGCLLVSMVRSDVVLPVPTGPVMRTLVLDTLLLRGKNLGDCLEGSGDPIQAVEERLGQDFGMCNCCVRILEIERCLDTVEGITDLAH